MRKETSFGHFGKQLKPYLARPKMAGRRGEIVEPVSSLPKISLRVPGIAQLQKVLLARILSEIRATGCEHSICGE
jgi:hypothetical protein